MDIITNAFAKLLPFLIVSVVQFFILFGAIEYINKSKNKKKFIIQLTVGLLIAISIFVINSPASRCLTREYDVTTGQNCIEYDENSSDMGSSTKIENILFYFVLAELPVLLAWKLANKSDSDS